MKKQLLSIIIILAAFSVSAQGFEAATYVERTSMNPKIGTSVGYEFNDRGEIGGFYQQIAQAPVDEAGRPKTTEEEFYGMYMAYPLVKARLTDLKVNVRTGVVNGESFTITPSLLANFHPFRGLTMGTGVGVRSFRPTVMATVSLNLGRSKINELFIAQRIEK